MVIIRKSYFVTRDCFISNLFFINTIIKIARIFFFISYEKFINLFWNFATIDFSNILLIFRREYFKERCHVRSNEKSRWRNNNITKKAS